MPKKPKKFKKIKENQQSPKNSRSIPEKKTESRSAAKQEASAFFTTLYFLQREWKIIVISFCAGVLVMAIGYTGFDVHRQLALLDVEQEKRIALHKEIATWETIVTNHPDYRDGYFQLALLYYQAGQRDKARVSLERVFQLDPTYEKALMFSEQLEEGE